MTRSVSCVSSHRHLINIYCFLWCVLLCWTIIYKINFRKLCASLRMWSGLLSFFYFCDCCFGWISCWNRTCGGWLSTIGFAGYSALWMHIRDLTEHVSCWWEEQLTAPMHLLATWITLCNESLKALRETCPVWCSLKRRRLLSWICEPEKAESLTYVSLRMDLKLNLFIVC